MSTVARARRTPRILSVANRGLERALRRGRGPSFLRLLTVAGRTTGHPRTTPIVPVTSDEGRTCVVSAYGETERVRNVRAANEVELRRGDDHRMYRARELDAAEAVPVLRAYLAMPTSRFVHRHFSVTADSTDDAIRADAPQHPTFALTPVMEP